MIDWTSGCIYNQKRPGSFVNVKTSKYPATQWTVYYELEDTTGETTLNEANTVSSTVRRDPHVSNTKKFRIARSLRTGQKGHLH